MFEHVAIVAADNNKTLNSNEIKFTNFEAGDPFPGSENVTAFTATTTPGAIWRSSGDPLPAPDVRITNIRESADGIITFDFNSEETAIADIVAADGEKEYFTLMGQKVSADKLGSGIYIERDANGRTRKVAVSR